MAIILKRTYTISDETLLEKIKNVDGPGSGLDADTLDGLHASAFAGATHGNESHDPDFLAIDGSNTPTSNIDWGGFRITNLGDPTDLQDAVNKYYVDHAVTALGARYYILSTDSGIADYKLTSLTASTGPEQSISVSKLTDGQYIAGWISPNAGEPAKLLAGVFNWRIYAEKTGGTQTLRLYWQLVERKGDGSEVVIGTSVISNEIVAGKNTYNIPLTLSADYEVASDSYIVGKIYASVSGPGNAPSVTLYFEGDSDSHWEIPVNTEILDGRYAHVTLDNVADATVLSKILNVDGSGSGLDADLLDGKEASDFMEKATYDTDNDGVVESADYAATAGDADTLDGQHASEFAPATHASNHQPGGSDALPTAAPSDITEGATASEGSSTSFARADHVHGTPSEWTPKVHGNESHNPDFLAVDGSNSPTAGINWNNKDLYNVAGLRFHEPCQRHELNLDDVKFFSLPDNLFDVLAFKPPNTAQYKSGGNWYSLSIPKTIFVPYIPGSLTITNGWEEVRLEWSPFDYVWVAFLHIWATTMGNKLRTIIDISADGSSWTTVVDTGDVNIGWPGVLTHYDLWNNKGKTQYLRIKLIPTWNTSNNIVVCRIALVGLYPRVNSFNFAKSRMPFYWDEDKKLYLYNDLNAQGNKITNLADPTDAQDAATKNYADGKLPLDTSSAIDAYMSGNKWLSVAPSGIVGLPRQSYVRAYLYNGGSDFEVSGGISTKVPFDIKEEDIQGEYDPVNYRFTASEGGKYLATFTILYYPYYYPAYVIAEWRKNGAPFGPYFRNRIHDKHYLSATATVIVEMDPGDYLEAFCICEQKGRLRFRENYTRMFIAKIH